MSNGSGTMDTGKGGGFPRVAHATIDLQDDGTITVENRDGSGEQIRVGNGGMVHWKCAPQSGIKWWMVMVKADTPFEDGSGSCGEAGGKEHGKKIGPNAHGGGTREYRYAVVVSDGQNVRLLDPEIVVGPVDDPEEDS